MRSNLWPHGVMTAFTPSAHPMPSTVGSLSMVYSKHMRMIPKPPNFVSILTEVSHSTFFLPYLLANLYKLVAQMQQKWLGQGGEHSDIISSTTSMTSSITSPTVSTTTSITPVTPKGEKLFYIWNINPSEMTQKLMPSGIKIKDLMGDTKSPKTDQHWLMCLSFHVHGRCWSSCQWKDDHWLQTQAEETYLQEYMKTQVKSAWWGGKEVLTWAITPLPPPKPPRMPTNRSPQSNKHYKLS